MTFVPFWKLRRLAPRAVRVLGRRSSQSPAMAAYEHSLKPHAEDYISTYDETRRYRADWKREMNEGRGAISALVQGIRSWQPLVQRDVPGFDSSDFADKPDVPDDVIEDGGRLIDTVIDFHDRTGEPLPYGEKLVENLEKLLKPAVKEWAEAEAADKNYQDLLAVVREKSTVLQADLVAFRKTMTSQVGRSDKDYQKLRLERAHTPDDDDDADAPEAPAPVSPAPEGVNEPIA